MKRKPRVGISACLLGHPVRYDGRDKYDPLCAETLAEIIEWVPVCPEVEFGLPVPREPIQLEGDPSLPELRSIHTSQEFSAEMREFCVRRISELGPLDGFVFKSKSPSCGLASPVHTNGKITGKAPGLFAAALMKLHPEILTVEAEQLQDETALSEFLKKTT